VTPEKVGGINLALVIAMASGNEN